MMLPFLGNSQELELFKDLSGKWKFTVGDNIAWSGIDVNDQDWDLINVPQPWELQGYNGYNGFAWYRKSFKISDIDSDLPIILQIGQIDDVDEVFLNGKKIGQTGKFYPDFETAYSMERKYKIPKGLLKVDSENVVAVRVYDTYYNGGITNGSIGLYYDITSKLLEINLEGTWRFAKSIPHDNINPKLADLKWSNIDVPGYWESQGFDNYDGYGVYYKKVMIPEKLNNEDLYLVLGKIDDYDYVYFNGKLIGKVFDLKDEGSYRGKGNEYSVLRTYKIPKELIRFNKENTIIIKVYDYFKDGGIYQGPIGIVNYENYKYLKEKYNNSKGNTLWNFLFD